VERRNLYTDENRKGARHRKIRPKVEMWFAGAEMPVVVMKTMEQRGIIIQLIRRSTVKTGGAC
jgi:hypothetical protein